MAKFNVGDKIVWAGNLDNGAQEIRTGTVTKYTPAQGELVWIDGLHKPEDCIYAAYCWPAKAHAELASILDKRLALKKAFDDSMKLLYELRNKVSRGEF